MAAKRIVANRCCGAIIDVQEFFIAQADKRIRSKIKTNTKNFARLLRYFRIPMIVTIERPIARKGGVPMEIKNHLGIRAKVFNPDAFAGSGADGKIGHERSGRARARRPGRR